MIHTTNCPGGTCDDPETTFLCDVCGRECAACFGVSESETCDDCEGKMELARLTDEDGRVITCDKIDGVKWIGIPYGIRTADALKLIDYANLNTTANELRAKLDTAGALLMSQDAQLSEAQGQLRDAERAIRDLRQRETLRPVPNYMDIE